MSKRIFISYKRHDKKRVVKIKNDIENAIGERCWIDIDGIESDAQFVNVIIKAIDDADIFLFMYSKCHTKIVDFEKDWTIREINYAQKSNKRIIFLNLDGAPLSAWFELMFGLKQQVDVSSSIAMDRLYVDLLNWLDIKERPLVPKTNRKAFKVVTFILVFIIILFTLFCVCYINHKSNKEKILETSNSYNKLIFDFDTTLEKVGLDNICFFEEAYDTLRRIDSIETVFWFQDIPIGVEKKKQLVNKLDNVYFELNEIYNSIPEESKTAKLRIKNKIDSVRIIQLKIM